MRHSINAVGTFARRRDALMSKCRNLTFAQYISLPAGATSLMFLWWGHILTAGLESANRVKNSENLFELVVDFVDDLT